MHRFVVSQLNSIYLVSVTKKKMDVRSSVVEGGEWRMCGWGKCV